MARGDLMVLLEAAPLIADVTRSRDRNARGRPAVDDWSVFAFRCSNTMGGIVDATESSGASRARTGDLLGAIQALSQLSYSPAKASVAPIPGQVPPVACSDSRRPIRAIAG